MPRERDPRRDQAFEIWKNSGGAKDLVEIAAQLGVSDGTVRGWKSKDTWESAAERKKRNAPKKGTERSKQSEREKERRNPVQASEPENDDLTDKNRVFVMEYLRDFNATRAAMAAGYNKKTAYSIGWELLRKPEIQAEIKRHKEMLSDEFGLDIRRIIAEYMKIAFTDITDLLEFGQKDVPVMSMFGPVKDEEGNPVMKTVNYVSFNESREIDGTVISEVKQGKDGVSIKLHDKVKALEKLERYVVYMTEEEKLKLDKLRAEVDLVKAEAKALGDQAGDGGNPILDDIPEGVTP